MQCYFCQHNIREIDFQNVSTLKHFIALSGKIRPRAKTHLCAKHQRALAKAVKRARELGLLSYTKK